jgi:hypothetical protein
MATQTLRMLHPTYDRLAETKSRWGYELRTSGIMYQQGQGWVFPDGHTELDLTEAWSYLHNQSFFKEG